MNIIKNEIQIGIEKPFTFLQITDTHLVCVSENECDERKAFAGSRQGLDSRQNLTFAQNYAKETGFPLFHTGDLIDFITREAMEISKSFAKEADVTFIAGNHEQCYCPDNRFCESDYAEELKVREKTLDNLQNYFENNVRFFCKEMGGVLLVGIDNGDYQVTRTQLNALKQVVSNGKPIILFTHIPFYSEELSAVTSDGMVGTPAEKMHGYNLWQLYEQTASPTTKEACDYILSCPIIKAIVSGHMHFDFEALSPTGQLHLITDRNTMREITVR